MNKTPWEAAPRAFPFATFYDQHRQELKLLGISVCASESKFLKPPEQEEHEEAEALSS